jgi:hypothetical protein
MRTVSAVLACVAIAAGAATAQQPATEGGTPAARPQEKPAAAAQAPARRPYVPLRVQLVLSRLKGEKKLGNLPYMLGVTANDGSWTNVRMGIDVPVATGPNAPGSFSYRSVGTNIDCQAEATTPEVYRLSVRVEDTSVIEASDGLSPGTGQKSIAGNMPAFRTFKSNFTVLLRDGQSSQYNSSVDPISGEVMKIDVTLNVVK